MGKKALSWGVVATTIAWSMGVATFAAPLVAKAAVTLPAGTLVKKVCPVSPGTFDPCRAVYYVGTDGKRHAFPDAKVYNSWYPDFSGITSLSSDDLNSVPLSGLNIVHRAGTYLIKINTVNTVYGVEPRGLIRGIASEAIASALWGSSWALRVRDVDDSVFGNYTLGADITSNTYPTGSLVKTASSPDIWYIDGASKRKITAEGFAANRFRFEFVVTTTLDLSVYANGTDISTGETALNDTAQLGGAVVTPPPGTGTGLTLSVASDNPVATTIVDDATGNRGAQAVIPFVKLRLTASADGTASITGIKVRRGGITADSNLGELYLYEGNSFDTQVGRSTTISSGVISFTGLAITIPAGGSKEIMVRGNLAVPSSGASNSSKTISMSVEAADITVSGSTAVSGSAVGNTMTISTVTDLGQAQFLNVTPTANNTVDPGVTGYELWRFKVTAADQNMIIKRLIFTQVGSIQENAIQNFMLKDGATQLGSTVPTMTGSKITFDLSGMTDGGFKITNGQTKQLGLHGDIIAGSGRTYRFSIQERTDALVWDMNYQVYTVPAKGTTNAWSVIQPNDGASPEVAVSTTINSGRLTVSTASDSPATNVPDGATNVTLAKWTFTASGEDVKVDNLDAYCSSGDGTTILKNVKLVLDGSQVGTTDATQTCDGLTANANNYSFGNSFIVAAGSTKTLSYVADLTDATVATGDTLVANLSAGSGNAQGTVTLDSISTSSASGRTVTVASGAIVTTEDASFTDRTATNPTGVLGAQGATIGQFIVTGGGEDADLTQFVLTDDVTGAGSTMADTFQNLKLWRVDGSTTTQIGNTVGTLTDTDGTTYTFTPSTVIRVTAGATKVFKITADIKTNGTVITADGVVFPSKVSATGVTTGTDVSDADGTATELQNVWILSNGNLSIYPDSATPIRSTMVLGSTGNELSRFKLEAGVAEDIVVSKIVISDVLTNGGALNATGTLKNLKLVDATSGVQYGGTIASLDSSSTGSSSAPVAIFDNITNLTVSRSGSVTFKVVADLTTYVDGGVTSSTHKLVLVPVFNDHTTTTDGAAPRGGNLFRSIIAVGRDSGFSISTTSLDYNTSSTNSDTDVYQVAGNPHDAFRTKITIAKSASAPSGTQTGGTEKTVAIFVVSNSSNVGSYSATLELMNLDIDQTGISNTAERFTRVWKDAASVSGNQLASTNHCSTVCVLGAGSFADTNWTDGEFTDTDISSGSSRTYYVTMDTNDAGADDRLTVGLAQGDIEWNDGSLSNGVAVTSIKIVDSLPVTGNTLSY